MDRVGNHTAAATVATATGPQAAVGTAGSIADVGRTQRRSGAATARVGNHTAAATTATAAGPQAAVGTAGSIADVGRTQRRSGAATATARDTTPPNVQNSPPEGEAEFSTAGRNRAGPGVLPACTAAADEAVSDPESVCSSACDPGEYGDDMMRGLVLDDEAALDAQMAKLAAALQPGAGDSNGWSNEMRVSRLNKALNSNTSTTLSAAHANAANPNLEETDGQYNARHQFMQARLSASQGGRNPWD